MTSTTDFDNAEITQQYSRINTRFELSDEELDNDNSSARLFERSRIKALAGGSCDIKLRICCFYLYIQRPTNVHMHTVQTHAHVSSWNLSYSTLALLSLTSQDHLHIFNIFVCDWARQLPCPSVPIAQISGIAAIACHFWHTCEDSQRQVLNSNFSPLPDIPEVIHTVHMKVTQMVGNSTQKSDSSSKNENDLIIYSSSCYF